MVSEKKKRVWFQRTERLVSKKRESEIEIWNEGQDPRRDHGDHEDDYDPVPGWQ